MTNDRDHRDEDAKALQVPDLFLKSSESISISQVDEGVPLAMENRLSRKRQLSVSKLIILHIIRVLTSENRNPNFHLPHVLGLVSPALGQKRSKKLNERAHRLWKGCDRLFKHKQHLQGRW